MGKLVLTLNLLCSKFAQTIFKHAQIMQILNIAGYKFIELNELATLRAALFSICQELNLKGTILLSPEGINISLAGQLACIRSFSDHLNAYGYFSGITFHETYSQTQPFKRLKVKLKKEIISFRKPEANPLLTRAPSMAPATLKKWLDENRDMTLLDTRNDYEIEFGTFDKAVNLHIDDFCEFPEAVKSVDKKKPIVMFCTGGIRCEKAALYLLDQGYQEVYQLEGGILGYFAKEGGAHYNGGCFVFDERVAVDSELQPART